MVTRKIKGASLIEVLVAFAIIAFSMTAFFGTYASLLKSQLDVMHVYEFAALQTALRTASLDYPNVQDTYTINGYNIQMTQERQATVGCVMLEASLFVPATQTMLSLNLDILPQ
jgi:Tfp pilus assembly protein PilV